MTTAPSVPAVRAPTLLFGEVQPQDVWLRLRIPAGTAVLVSAAQADEVIQQADVPPRRRRPAGAEGEVRRCRSSCCSINLRCTRTCLIRPTNSLNRATTCRTVENLISRMKQVMEQQA